MGRRWLTSSRTRTRREKTSSAASSWTSIDEL